MLENIELQKKVLRDHGNFFFNLTRKIQLFSGICGITVRSCEVEFYSKEKSSLKKFSPVLGGLRNVVISCKQRSCDPNKFTSELIKTVAFFPTSELFEIQRHIAKNSSFHPTGELIWYKDI